MPPSIRLVLTEENGRMRGAVQRGSETISPWSVYNVPADIVRFLALHYYYESSPRYFESFFKVTGGRYPLVYRGRNGRERELTYRADVSHRACLTFALSDDEVQLTRTLDGCAALSENMMVHGLLLFDLTGCTIHPLANSEAWRIWDTIIEELECTLDFGKEWPDTVFDDDDEFYDFDDESLGDEPHGLRRIPNGMAVSVSLFNAAAVRLTPDMMAAGFDETFFFLSDGVVADTSQRTKCSCLLDIPGGITEKTVTLVPLGMDGVAPFPFSGSTFWFLDPAKRSHLSTPLKAKKRVRTILETGFALLDETKITARTAVIRTALSTLDFIKRDVKRDAKKILNTFAEQCGQHGLLIRIASDGWRFAEEDRHQQARLVQIMFEMFGADAFSPAGMPGEVELAADILLRDLPQFAARLRDAGFSLRLGNEVMTAASWEFHLDATTSTLDWFELRPEIRCNGELLSEDEVRGLLGGNGIIRRDGRLLLLDELNAQVLAMFAGAMPVGKRRRKGEQELVRVPRLQILDWLLLRGHGITITLSPDDAALLDSLLNFEAIPERPVPVTLIATLRHYQVDAWRWLAFLYAHRFGACLADDMGLGKTVQGIALLAGIIEGAVSSFASPGTPHLIVVPPSLLFNWEAEIARFLPGAKVLLYTGSGRSVETFAGYDIVVTSYGIVHRDIEQLEQLRFDVIVFDETQVVKNLKAATSNAVRRLKAVFVLALTGTPVENHLGEYYAIMDLCLPGLLGSREEFARQIGQGGQAGINRLIRRTKPFILRRSKQMIAAELPPKIETDIHLELSPKQKLLYQRTVEEVRGLVRDAFARHLPGQARIIALTAILRLRQICLAPSLAAPGSSDSSPKLDFLAEQLLELRDEGHSALVFSQFTSYLDIIEKGLKHHGLNYVRLDGSTPVAQRKNLVNSFQNSSEPAVFLISLKAGGKGLNLTRATYVFHMDPWWNPAVENQASDRAHRIGQTEQVTITRLIMRHTIEEKMMVLKEQKLKLYKAILEEGEGGAGAGLTREDFEYLLG